MRYPGRLIKAGEGDARIVAALKRQLNRRLGLTGEPSLRLDETNPTFGAGMKQLVRLFQARHVDGFGRPLKQDGEVGALTWAALFGQATVPAAERTGDPLLARMLRIAAAEQAKGVRERPKDSNRGPEVDVYLERAGVWPGLSWCCAFVYWCFDEAARELGAANPMYRTAGCMAHWQHAASRGARRIVARDAVQDPSQVKPGMVFIMDHGRGLGHTGLVESVEGGLLTTIEGNTDASLTREGGGVYRLQRKMVDINKGFIDYAGLVALPAPPPRAARRSAASAPAAPRVAARKRRVG